MTETDLHQRRASLLHSLHHSSTPKQILQSISFQTSLSIQSLQKFSLPPRPSSSTTSKLDHQTSLLPVKKRLVDTAEKFLALKTTLGSIPRREYSTTEAKCRALRAARTEALDRLDEIISSGEQCQINEDWNDDIAAAKELIVPHLH